MSGNTDEPWLWALLEIAPTPGLGLRVSRVRARRLLQSHRIRRLGEDDVLRALRQKALPVAPGTAEAASGHVSLLLARLRLAHDQRGHCAKQIEAALEELTTEDPEGDAALLQSLPGIGRVVAAAILIEASELLAARDYHRLRIHAGIAPVTRRSGKRMAVVLRRACSGRLRQAMYHWASCSMQRVPHSRELYRAARARGQSHGRALRGLADQLLRVLITILRTRTPYDPERFSTAA